MTELCDVLVVDDEEDARTSLQEWLELEGFRVSAAGSGREALDWIRSRGGEGCVMLLDLFMPDVDGWRVYDTLRDEGRLDRVKVLVTTSAPHLAPSGSTILPKPLDLNAVVDAIHRASKAV